MYVCKANFILFLICVAISTGSAVENVLDKSSDKLFNEAMEQYEQANYWESARDLIVLLDFHPTYSKIDKSIYMLGDCLYEIGLKDGAAQLYQHLINKHVTSKYLPNAILGLERIAYDKSDFEGVIKYYEIIVRGNPSQEINDGANYFAGLAYQKYKDYNLSIELLQKVSSKSPYYPYALYSVGIANLRMKKVRQALEAFDEIKKLAITNDVIRGAVDETNLTLGYIYYELGYYQQALKQFSKVSSDHPGYGNALLAMGWTMLKMANFQGSIAPLTQLISVAPNSDLAEEGMFLLGRAYLKVGLYTESKLVYQNLIDLFPDVEHQSTVIKQVEGALEYEQINLENIRLELLMLETKLIDLLKLSAKGPLSDHLTEEKIRLQETRDGLLNRIREEREIFKDLTYQLNLLKRRTEIRQDRRNWRVYAEYGLSRASFLERMQEQNIKVGQ